jgi:ABC-type multidrug transport system fused ATPase/permease subunit
MVMNKVQQAYISRIEHLDEQKTLALKRGRRLMWLRLLSFVAAIAALFSLFSLSVVAATAISLLFLALFAVVAIRDMRNQRHITYLDNLITISQDEIDAIEGNFAAFDAGQEFFDVKHPYSYDLDIFGQQSIYQMVCRATTASGKGALASRLQHPLPKEEIAENQEAIAELAEEVEWRQDFFEAGKRYSATSSNIKRVLEWAAAPGELFESRLLRATLYIMPPITIALGVLWALGILPGAFFLALIVHMVVYNKYGKQINLVQAQVANAESEMRSYSTLLMHIEQGRFTSPRLIRLQKELEMEGEPSSAIVKQFASLVDKLDYRLNIIFLFTVNALLFWDLRMAIHLTDWRKKYAPLAQKWVDAVGEMEALTSLATLSYNNPDWTFPKICDGYFMVDAEDAAHPLIPKKQRVANSFRVEEHEKVLLLTGSNMAGKSTFLRTLGVNMVLAYAGSVVCAERFEVSYVPLRSSMRITDSLIENTSSFYAEIKRLGEIVKAVKEGEKPFLLLDEILRGTNSNDRHIGSRALIDLLVEYGVCGIIATHDLTLAQAKDSYPEALTNYHFDVQVDANDELFFDYKVKTGICTSLNASILMRKIGLKV